MKGQLSSAHIDAINRRRRVIVNFDVISADGARFATKELERLVEWKFMFADEPGTHIDSIYWSWGEGIRHLIRVKSYRSTTRPDSNSGQTMGSTSRRCSLRQQSSGV